MQYISKGQWGAILICATLITAFHNKWNKLVHNFTIKIHMLTTNKSQSLEWQHGQHFKFGPLKHALISHINTTAFLLHMITTRAVHPTWRSPWAKKTISASYSDVRKGAAVDPITEVIWPERSAQPTFLRSLALYNSVILT